MANSGIRSTLGAKIAQALRVLVNTGPSGVVRKMRDHLRYHLDDKWRFVYLQFDLSVQTVTMAPNSALTIRVATMADAARIHSELFTEMQGEQSYDKRYFDLLGRDDVLCFVAERGGRLIHYSWVFFDVGASPMVETPVDRRCLREGDVFVGPVFTVPDARGFVYPHVLSAIIRQLQGTLGARRIVLFVYEKNQGAVAFHKRMGFTDIENARSRSVAHEMLAKLLIRDSAKKA